MTRSLADLQEDMLTVAYEHGFTSEYSGGAGSTEMEHHKFTGHIVSASYQGNGWYHAKDNGDGFDHIASGKTAASLERHLKSYKFK